MNTRSNENRLGVNPDTPEEKGNGTANVSEPQTLKFITPTEFVELPSKGQFYRPEHPLHNQEVIEIKHMTTREEDILTSVALLKKGVALDRMLESILVNKTINVDDLLIGDKNALIMAARAHGYGSLYETNVKCPDCTETQDYSFKLDSLEVHSPSDEFMTKHNVKKTKANTFLVPLPKTKYTIEIKFLTGNDEKRLERTQEFKKKKNFVQTTASDFLRLVIVSVNNIHEEGSLNEFINTLPALHGRYIRKVYDELMPSIDMNHSFTCSACSYEGALEVPLTADFFWPHS